jgi:hypothetical protein
MNLGYIKMIFMQIQFQRGMGMRDNLPWGAVRAMISFTFIIRKFDDEIMNSFS